MNIQKIDKRFENKQDSQITANTHTHIYIYRKEMLEVYPRIPFGSMRDMM